MRPYEVVFIFDADLDEGTIRSVVDRSVEQIASAGGEPGRVDHWGKRRFAFELRHRTEGYYVVFRLKAEPAVVQELDRNLSLDDDVLRHRVVRIPESAYATSAREPTEPEETVGSEPPEAADDSEEPRDTEGTDGTEETDETDETEAAGAETAAQAGVTHDG